MPESIIINYWILNKVYIIVALFIIIGFFIINYMLFIQFEIEVSKELNTDCKNPIAIYFDKEGRDRCLNEKIGKSKEFNTTEDYAQNKTKLIETKVKDINKRIQETDKYYKEIEKREYPEIKNIQKIYPILVNIYENVQYTFENSQDRMEKVKTDFETTVGNIIQNVVDIGNNLVNHLKLKMKVPKWDKRKELVNGYEKIQKYLKNKKIKPYLDEIKDDPENLAKLQNIKNLPEKTKTGPKKK
jgi:membrane-associated HD superfamily phosphohydrolase